MVEDVVEVSSTAALLRLNEPHGPFTLTSFPSGVTLRTMDGFGLYKCEYMFAVTVGSCIVAPITVVSHSLAI